MNHEAQTSSVSFVTVRATGPSHPNAILVASLSSGVSKRPKKLVRNIPSERFLLI